MVPRKMNTTATRTLRLDIKAMTDAAVLPFFGGCDALSLRPVNFEIDELVRNRLRDSCQLHNHHYYVK